MRTLRLLGTAAVLGGTLLAPLGAAAQASAPPVPDGGGHMQAGAGGQRAPMTAGPAAPSGYSVTGIGAASYQGNVDWSQVAASGRKFALVKATEGTTYTNPYFSEQYGGAKAAGLYAAAYAFARPDANDPVQQADYLVANAQFADDGKTLPLMLDMEGPYDGISGYDQCWNLSTSAMTSWITAFVDEVRKATGKPMIIYTSASWWNTCTGGTSALSDQWLDVASWTSASSPTMPSGWPAWTFWQYSGGSSTPGVSGPADQDVFYGSLAQLAALAAPASGAATSRPEIVSPTAGAVDAFYEGFDKNLWQTAEGSNGWSAPTSVGFGPLDGSPVAAAQPSGTIDVFWRGPDQGLWHSWWGAGHWNGPQAFGGLVNGDPAAVTDSDRGVDIFWQGTDGRLWTKQYRPGAGWSANAVVSAARTICSAPGAVEATDGTVDVFWRGCNGGLWGVQRAGQVWPAGPTRLGGSVAGPPVPVFSSSGVLNVFYRGTDGNLWHSWRNGTAWHGPRSLGSGPLGSDPSAAGQASGAIDVFWRGTGRHAIWHVWYRNGWHGPQSLGGVAQTQPRTVVRGNGSIDVVFNDGSRSLGHLAYVPGAGWSRAGSLGGFLA